MRVIFAFVMIVLAGFSLAQPMSQKDIFLVTVRPGAYATVRLHGTKSNLISGFRFTVTRRADGALPVVRQSFHRKFLASSSDYLQDFNALRILRKVPDAVTETYAWIINWFHIGGSGFTGNGLLLEPGEYMVYVPDPVADPDRYTGAVLIGGHYLDLAAQQDHWQLVADRFDRVSVSTPELIDPIVYGFRFTVRAREDGALPVINQSLYEMHIVREELELWKLGEDGRFFRFASWSYGRRSPMESQPAPGLLLSPGEYLLRASNNSNARSLIRYAVLLSGFWSPRD